MDTSIQTLLKSKVKGDEASFQIFIPYTEIVDLSTGVVDTLVINKGIQAGCQKNINLFGRYDLEITWCQTVTKLNGTIAPIQINFNEFNHKYGENNRNGIIVLNGSLNIFKQYIMGVQLNGMLNITINDPINTALGYTQAVEDLEYIILNITATSLDKKFV